MEKVKSVDYSIQHRGIRRPNMKYSLIHHKTTTFGAEGAGKHRKKEGALTGMDISMTSRETLPQWRVCGDAFKCMLHGINESRMRGDANTTSWQLRFVYRRLKMDGTTLLLIHVSIILVIAIAHLNLRNHAEHCSNSQISCECVVEKA